VPLLGTVTMFAISFLVVTIPDEWIERQVISLSQPSAAIEPGVAANTDVPTETNCTFYPWHALNVVSISRTYRGGSELRRAMPCWTYLMLEGPKSFVSVRRNLIVSNKDLVAIRPMPELLRDKRGIFLKAVWDDVGEGLDLRGRDLRFANLAYSDLRKADFRGADLWGAKLMDARLDYAQFRDIPMADLGTCTSGVEDDSVKTCRTNLRKADLQNAKAKFTSFFKADLEGANLYWAELFDSDLNHANLANITWLHTSIEETDVPFPYHCSVKRLGANYSHPPSHCGCSQPPPLSMRGLASICSKKKAVSVFPG
jgi:Pentapeptide repeats (8 copies)